MFFTSSDTSVGNRAPLPPHYRWRQCPCLSALTMYSCISKSISFVIPHLGSTNNNCALLPLFKYSKRFKCPYEKCLQVSVWKPLYRYLGWRHSVNFNSKTVYEDEIFGRQDILQFFVGEFKGYKYVKFPQTLGALSL